MRVKRSVTMTLALCCLALVAVGARGCPFQEMVDELIATLDDHEDRIEEVEACTCCCDGRFDLVCGDNGLTYLNACEAECAGAEVEQVGGCTPGNACDGDNPAGCVQTGCDEGEVCFRDGNQCIPSACACDVESESWICTDDCGGGECIGGPQDCPGSNPAGCGADNPCAEGEVCFRDGGSCIPSACACDASAGTWLCTADCSGGTCLGG